MKYFVIFYCLYFGFLSSAHSQSSCSKYLGTRQAKAFERIYEFLNSNNSVLVFETRIKSLKAEGLRDGVWSIKPAHMDKPHGIGVVHIENSHKGKQVFFRISEMLEQQFMNNDEVVVANYFRPVITFTPNVSMTKGAKTSRKSDVRKISEQEIVILDQILIEYNLEHSNVETLSIRLRKEEYGAITQIVEFESKTLKDQKTTGERYRVVVENLPIDKPEILKEILDIYFMTEDRNISTLQ